MPNLYADHGDFGNATSQGDADSALDRLWQKKKVEHRQQ